MPRLSEVLLVILAGALGGFTSVMAAWGEPTNYPVSFVMLWTLAIVPCFKGGVAAGLGVYLLTTPDKTNFVRTFFFAVACGLTFPGILTNGASLASSVTRQVAGQHAEENKVAIRSLTETGKAVSVESIPKLEQATVALVKSTSKLEPAQAKAASVEIDSALSGLFKSAAKGDAEALDAIESIGKAAYVVNDAHVYAKFDKQLAEFKPPNENMKLKVEALNARLKSIH